MLTFQATRNGQWQTAMVVFVTAMASVDDILCCSMTALVPLTTNSNLRGTRASTRQLAMCQGSSPAQLTPQTTSLILFTPPVSVSIYCPYLPPEGSFVLFSSYLSKSPHRRRILKEQQNSSVFCQLIPRASNHGHH